MESGRIYPIDTTFKSYPITSAVSAEQMVVNPNTMDCVVTIKVKKLFGGYRLFTVTVSEDTFFAVKAYLKPTSLVG